jgi:hypothetical protein
MGYMLEGLNYLSLYTHEYLFSPKEDLDLCNLSFIMQVQGFNSGILFSNPSL